jgi:hypothetical protein
LAADFVFIFGIGVSYVSASAGVAAVWLSFSVVFLVVFLVVVLLAAAV